MLTNEELERKLDTLSAENATLRRRLTDLEESVDGHVGINYGAAQQLAPHPSMQIQTATFGGEGGRLGSSGIQIRGNLTTAPGLYFVDDFLDDPYNHEPRSRIYGFLTSELGEIDMVTTSPDATGNTQIRMYTYDTISEMTLSANNSGFGGASLTLHGDNIGIGKYAQFTAGLMLFSTTSDPAVLYDSMAWYRSDTDRFVVRANGITRNLTMDGTNTTLTIASGAVTATTSFHAIDTEAAAATDDLDTISGGQTGQVLYLHAANGARDVVAKDGTGNLKLAGDFTMNNAEDVLTLIFDGSNWLEVSRSDNGA